MKHRKRSAVDLYEVLCTKGAALCEDCCRSQGKNFSVFQVHCSSKHLGASPYEFSRILRTVQASTDLGEVLEIVNSKADLSIASR